MPCRILISSIQKSWHVYNQDNRQKVEADELKQKVIEDAAREKHVQAERQHRHQLLLARVRGSSGSVIDPELPAESLALQIPSSTTLTTATHQDLALALAQQPASAHVNFFQQEEDKAQHPDTVVSGCSTVFTRHDKLSFPHFRFLLAGCHVQGGNSTV